MQSSADTSTDLFDASVNGLTPTRGLLGEGKGQDFDEYADRYGRVRLWHFANRIGVFESSGGLVAAHAKFIVGYFGQHIDGAEGGRYGFGNWLALTAYNTDVRRILTDWQQQQQYEGAYVAQTSKLLAMSVSVANAVLDREIRTFPTLAELHGEFLHRMQKEGLQYALGSSVRALRPIA